MTLLLAALTVASVTYTFTSSSLFAGVRTHIEQRLAGRKLLILLVRCQYCLSHWFAVPVVMLLGETWRESASIYFPSVLLAVCALKVFGILVNADGYMQAQAAIKSTHWQSLVAQFEASKAQARDESQQVER